MVLQDADFDRAHLEGANLKNADPAGARYDSETLRPGGIDRSPNPRMSVTDRCNFRCVYCMPREGLGRDYEFCPPAT